MSVTAGREGGLAPIKELLLRTCGLQFEKEREKTLAAGVSRRMSGRGVAAEGDYLRLLREDGAEFQHLVELLTVNETYFFREPDQLKLMAERVVPEILQQRGGPVRIVSAGCSTGEEPYSVAIMLRERFGVGSESSFAICGVDIDAGAVASAKQGVYGPGSFRGMDAALRERYFRACGPDSYQLGEIRRQVAFDVVNLLGSSYPPLIQRPDIILYRNVSIYFPTQVQKEIFARLAALLQDGGALFVGASETMHHNVGILTLTERDGLFFYRKTPRAAIGERRSPGRRALQRETPSPPLTRAVASETRGATKCRPQGPPLSSPPCGGVKPHLRRAFDNALELARGGRMDEALTALDPLIEEAPSFTKARSLKGSILMSLSRYAEARSACLEALRRDPLCLEAVLILGITARQQGDDEEARRRFREAIYLRPSCWLGHFYLAEIVFSLGDRRRARSGFAAALRILEEGAIEEHGREFFPLSFNAAEFITICRHKLSLLKENR